MSIDWVKVELKPDKEVKVIGTILLDYKNRVMDLENKVSSLNEKIEKLTKLKSDHEAKINELQDKVVVDLKNRLANQEKDISSLHANGDKLSKIKAENEATIADLQKKVANLEASIKDKDATIGNNASTIATQNGKIDGLQVSLDTTIGEKDRQIRNLVEEKNAMKTQLDDRIRGLESDKSTLQDTEASLKGQLAEMEASHRNKIEGLEAESKKRQAEFESKYHSVEQEKFAFKKEKDDLTDKLQFMDEQLKAKDFEYFRKLSKERAERASKAYQPKS